MPPAAPAIPRPRDIDLTIQVLSELRQLLQLAQAQGWSEMQIALKPRVMNLAILCADGVAPPPRPEVKP